VFDLLVHQTAGSNVAASSSSTSVTEILHASDATAAVASDSGPPVNIHVYTLVVTVTLSCV